MSKGRCKHCGGPARKVQGASHFRKYCDRRECQYVAHSAHHFARWEGKRQPDLPTKRCGACGTVKPRDLENFGSVRRDKQTGEVREYHSYCRPCARADGRARYASDRKRQEKARQRAARQREEIRAKRAADPEFDAAFRRLQREYERGERRRSPDPPPPRKRDPRIPAAPLAAAVKALVHREQPRNPITAREDGDTAGGRIEVVCMRAGISDRQLRGWLSGEWESVQLAVADRVLTRLEILWHDVYPPDRYPEVAAVLGAC